MILLDTDHLSVLTDTRDRRYQLLDSRLQTSTDAVASSIISVEEMLRGWLALIHRLRDSYRQIPAYARLQQLFDTFRLWEIMAFDQRAAEQFEGLRKQRIRLGSMDLKVASIALANNALLLTANLRDFSRIPNLRCDNWLRE